MSHKAEGELLEVRQLVAASRFAHWRQPVDAMSHSYLVGGCSASRFVHWQSNVPQLPCWRLRGYPLVWLPPADGSGQSVSGVVHFLHHTANGYTRAGCRHPSSNHPKPTKVG